MKRLVQWIQLPELSPLPVMDRVFEECTGAFEDDRCVRRRITRWEELEDGGLVFLDDAAGKYKEPSHQAIHRRLAEHCPSSVFICWYWRDTTYRPFPKMLYTGEYYLNREQVPEDRNYLLHPDYVPLRLRANESPERICHYPRVVTRSYCFMGGGYKQDWLPPASQWTGLYHRVIWDNYMTYEARRETYLSSEFAFGFQSDMNIRTGHLSQRLFEGMAYGCLVLCENPLAEKVTDGAIITVHSREDMWEKMKYFTAHPEEAEARRQRGYEWSRKYGTNRTAMTPFVERIRSRFHLSWDISPTVVSVGLLGGLGNQLFQVAAAYAYAKKHGATFQLSPSPTNGTRTWYWDTLLSSVAPYIVPSLPPTLLPWHETLPTMYRPIDPLPSQGIHLYGYLQSSRYFQHPATVQAIRALFRPPPDLLHAVHRKYADLIRQSHRVVVLHARRTDYVTAKEFHGPLEAPYYRQAVERILGRVKDPLFLLSSDDPAFWESIREDIPAVFQHDHLLLEDSDIYTFLLLQQFPYFILSNSTFIWWCAWLARTKHAIAPALWFGPKGPAEWSDIYEKEWEII